MDPVQETAIRQLEREMAEGGFDLSANAAVDPENPRTAYVVTFSRYGRATTDDDGTVTRYVLSNGRVV